MSEDGHSDQREGRMDIESGSQEDGSQSAAGGVIRELGSYLPLILANEQRFEKDRALGFTLIAENAHLSLAYGGGGYLPLGTLLQFWQPGRFTAGCTECGGTVYLYGAGGSLLSGAGSMWGVCAGCGSSQKTGFNTPISLALRQHSLFQPFQHRVAQEDYLGIHELMARLVPSER